MNDLKEYNSEDRNAIGVLPVLQKVFLSVLYSSVFISFCGFALTVETYQLAGIPVSFPMAWFVFLATLFTYNVSSVQAELARFIYGRRSTGTSWVLRHRRALSVLAVVALLLAAFIYLYFRLEISFWFLLHLAIISIGYTVPILYRARQAKPLRRVPLLKVFLIAYVWSAVTIFFPLMDAGQEIWSEQGLMLFLRRFLFILSLALLFDIRDFTYDRNTNTLTIPGLIGVQKTKVLSLALLAMYAVLVILSETGPTLTALLLGAAGAAVVVLFSAEYKKRIYYLLLADGAMLLHAGLIYLAKS